VISYENQDGRIILKRILKAKFMKMCNDWNWRRIDPVAWSCVHNKKLGFRFLTAG
jgi:hypothetical protein